MSSSICAGDMHVTWGIKGREIVENYTERDSYFIEYFCDVIYFLLICLQ